MMFIEITETRYSSRKRLINILTIKQVYDYDTYCYHNYNESKDYYCKAVIEFTNGEVFKCSETYDEIRNMVIEQEKEIRGKVSRFDLMDLERKE